MNAQDEELAKIAWRPRKRGETWGAITTGSTDEVRRIEAHIRETKDAVMWAEYREEEGKVTSLKFSICRGYWGAPPATMFILEVNDIINGQKPEHVEYWVHCADGRTEQMERPNSEPSI